MTPLASAASPPLWAAGWAGTEPWPTVAVCISPALERDRGGAESALGDED